MIINRPAFCRICGAPIDPSTKRIKYCSQECYLKASKEKQRQFWREKSYTLKPYLSGSKRIEGYAHLAAAVVIAAIEDIKRCSLQDIRNYEDPVYRASRDRLPQRCKDYMSAKSFLLSERFRMFYNFSGKEIYNLIIREKEKKERGQE